MMDVNQKIFGSEGCSAKHFTAKQTVVGNTREYLKNKNTGKYAARVNTEEYGSDYWEVLLPHSVINYQPIGDGTGYGKKKLVAE